MNYQYTVRDLKALAKERGLRRYSTMRKTELIALLPARILDSSVPDIPAPVLQPSQYVPSVKKEIEGTQTKSKVRKIADWIINYIPELLKQIPSAIISKVNSLYDRFLKKKVNMKFVKLKQH